MQILGLGHRFGHLKPSRSGFEARYPVRAFAAGGTASSHGERSLAKRLGVPRTTIQHWRGRRETSEAPAAVVAFFESPEGAQMLQQLLVGAHFVISLLGSGGIRLVCQFLELSGLSAFIASSYGVQQRINATLEEAVVEHARMQREQLAQDMPSKTITVNAAVPASKAGTASWHSNIMHAIG
jgi:hypothetical protein